MKLIRHIKAAIAYATHFPWMDQPVWDKDDATALAAFLTTPTGARLKAHFVHAVLVQQAHAVQAGADKLVWESGFCAGQKGTVAYIESLANAHNFTEQGEQDTDPATNQQES